jgi:hypothetical protein
MSNATVLAPKFPASLTAARTEAVGQYRKASVAEHAYIREGFAYVQNAGKGGNNKAEQTGLIRAAIEAFRNDFKAYRQEMSGIADSTTARDASHVKALFESAIMGTECALKWLQPIKAGAKQMPLQTWYANRPGATKKSDLPQVKAAGVAPVRETKTPEPTVAHSVTVDADPKVAIRNAFEVAKDAILTLRTLKANKEMDILRGLVEEHFANVARERRAAAEAVAAR